MIAAERVAVLIQARMSSARLPGKVLAPLAGQPAIVRMVERVRRVQGAGRLVVATSDDRSDDVLALVCHEHGIPCSRGPLDDVLHRMAAAVPEGSEVIVRLTGDCPLIDPALVDLHISRYVAGEATGGYVTNVVSRTYPDGLDVEVMSRDLLIEAARRATTASDREHVTPWIQRHATITAVTQPVDLSALRWVLDTPSDYAALSAVYEALHPEKPAFDSLAVYRLLWARPDLLRVADGASMELVRERIGALLAVEDGE